MALTFTYLKTLATGDQLRIREAVPPDAIRLAVKIGASPIQEVIVNPSELDELRFVFNGLAASRIKDPS
jgi:hypothetical protein